ncbi:MAG: acyl-CoA dehydrogenase family protein [Alphaproteobacteria bacterium]|jgi:acyl-CoA dehydrogenase|nr:acyl-CoA dehydrogenase family protein [Alphaproteobacteria bacterium]
MSDEMAAFAEAEVAGRDDLVGAETVPAALWRGFGRAGLFALGLPESYGGRGGGYAEIAAAAATLAAVGGCLGLATSYSLQCLVPRFFVLGFGDERQKKALLGKLATAEITVSVAISEPEAGAHPKHLATAARRDGDAVVIDGAKHWLTNGPMADLFIVLAVSGQEAARKRFSAYLVPRSTPGLEIVPMAPLGFLEPSPHCGLRLDACRLPADARLGPEGGAFEAMAGPLRDLEDAVMTGALAGAARWQLDRLGELAAAKGLDDGEALETLGGLAERLAVLEAAALRAAAELDAAPLGEPPSSAIAGGFRLIAGRFQEIVSGFVRDHEIGGDPALERVTRDLTKSLGIALQARGARRRKRGAALIGASKGTS